MEALPMPKTTSAILVTLFLSSCAFAQTSTALNAGALDSYQIRYFANLTAGDGDINLTNAGFLAATDPAGDICANLYVFAEDQQLAACCACPLTPNHLSTLSVQKDLLSNLLTPGMPSAITVAVVVTPESAGTCNAASIPVASSSLVSGLLAWGTTLHALPSTGYTVSESPFIPAPLSSAELGKMTSYCGFIQAIGSGYGICGSCRAGAAGAEKQ
jgi:hypothetical protein